MLGELVVKEIKQIEGERACGCPTCGVSAAIRAVNMFVVKTTCECPVCTECRSTLVAQAQSLQAFAVDHKALDEEIETIRQSPIINPNSGIEQKYSTSIQGIGVIRALTMALMGNAKRYASICESAHAAYEIVAGKVCDETSEAILQKLTSAAHETLAILTPINDPRNVN